MLLYYPVQITLDPPGIAHAPEESYSMIDKMVIRENLVRQLAEAQTLADSYDDGSFAVISENDADAEQKALEQRDLAEKTLARFDHLVAEIEEAEAEVDTYHGSVVSIIMDEGLTDQGQKDAEARLADAEQALADFVAELNS